MDFATNKNKAFLWDFLYKNGMFKHLMTDHETRVKDIFEQEIQKIEKVSSGENAIALNKTFIANMVMNINRLQSESQPQNHQPQNHQPQNHQPQNIHPSIQPTMKYTHQEAAAERQKLFQNNLQETEHNFNELMKVAKPKNIDFSDKDNMDKTDPELDSKLVEIVERRKRDMNMALSSYDVQSKPSTNIQIGKETSIAEEQIIDVGDKKMKKSVSFELNNITASLEKNMEQLLEKPADAINAPIYENTTNNEIDAFLSRLKTKPISEAHVAEAHVAEAHAVEARVAEAHVANKNEKHIILQENTKDADTMQTILREIAEMRETVDNILRILKQ